MDDSDDFFDSPRSTIANSKNISNDFKFDNSRGDLEVNSITSAKPPAYPNHNKSHNIEHAESKIVIEAKVPTIEATVDEYAYSDDEFHDDDEPRSVHETKIEHRDDRLEMDNLAGHIVTDLGSRRRRVDAELYDPDSKDESVIVSPLDTPLSQHGSKHAVKSRPKSSLSNKSYSNYVRSKTNGSDVSRARSDATDLDVLLKTVLNMGTGSSRIQEQPPRASKPTPQRPGSSTRRNFSFTDDQIRAIDRENERLMKKIIKHATDAKKTKGVHKGTQHATSSTTTVRRPSSSAINRAKQLQKIEAENLMLLNRLQKTRPSRDLQRDVLVDGYEQRQLGSASTSTAVPRSAAAHGRLQSGTRARRAPSASSSSADRPSRPATVFASRPDDDDILTWENTTMADGW